jgi:hypothetical protein
MEVLSDTYLKLLLSNCCQNINVTFTKILLKRGIRPTLPKELATSRPSLQSIPKIYQYHCDKPENSSGCMLDVMCARGQTKMVEVLLQYLPYSESDLMATLYLACYFGHIEIVKLLLASHPNLFPQKFLTGQQGKKGTLGPIIENIPFISEEELCLKISVKKGYPQIVKLLLKYPRFKQYDNHSVMLSRVVSCRDCPPHCFIMIISLLLTGGIFVHRDIMIISTLIILPIIFLIIIVIETSSIKINKKNK